MMNKLKALFIICAAAVCAVSCGEKPADNAADDTAGKADAVTTEAQPVSESVDIPAEAEKALKEFAESSISGDVDTMLKRMYPENMIDAMEKAGIKQEFAVAVSGSVGGKLNGFSIDGCTKLSDEAILKAENYYESFAAGLQTDTATFKINDGYSLNMNIDMELNGESGSFSDPVSVVLIDGDGWKLIPASEQDLLEMGQQQEQTQASSES